MLDGDKWEVAAVLAWVPYSIDDYANMKRPLLNYVHILIDLATVLDFLHSKEIIHRSIPQLSLILISPPNSDIKPGNCRIDAKESLILLDLGLSEFHPALEDMTDVGSSTYKDPHIKDGKYGSEVDIYSTCHLINDVRRLLVQRGVIQKGSGQDEAWEDIVALCMAFPKWKTRPTAKGLIRMLHDLLKVD